jgi:hypothetical protein
MFSEKATHKASDEDSYPRHDKHSEQWQIVHDVFVVEGKWVR